MTAVNVWGHADELTDGRGGSVDAVMGAVHSSIKSEMNALMCRSPLHSEVDKVQGDRARASTHIATKSRPCTTGKHVPRVGCRVRCGSMDHRWSRPGW